MSDLRNVHDSDWQYVVTLLPADVDETAHTCDALRRCRGVPNARALLRVALAYAVSDLSLKDVAAWAKAMDVAHVTPQGLFYRLCHAEVWLERVLASVLEQQVPPSICRFRLRIVDATTLTGPGADRPDWRLHVLSEPSTGRLSAVRITDEKGAETYARHQIDPGDVVVGDRGYATARGIHAAVQAGAHVVARFHPLCVRLCNADRQVVRVQDEEPSVPEVGSYSLSYLLPVPPERLSGKPGWRIKEAVDWIPVRIIAARTRAGTVTWLMTTLPDGELSDGESMAIYRLRWQIELFFKRLKSLHHIDALPSRHGPIARSWILARLLACALAQQLLDPSGALSPWGYAI